MSATDREYITEVTKDMSGSSAIAMIASSLQGTKLRLGECVALVLFLWFYFFGFIYLSGVLMCVSDSGPVFGSTYFDVFER